MTDNALPLTWKKFGAACFVSMDTIDRYGVTFEEIKADVNRKLEADIRHNVSENGFELKRGPRFEEEFRDEGVLGRGYMLRAIALAGPKNE